MQCWARQLKFPSSAADSAHHHEHVLPWLPVAALIRQHQLLASQGHLQQLHAWGSPRGESPAVMNGFASCPLTASQSFLALPLPFGVNCPHTALNYSHELATCHSPASGANGVRSPGFPVTPPTTAPSPGASQPQICHSLPGEHHLGPVLFTRGLLEPQILTLKTSSHQD